MTRLIPVTAAATGALIIRNIEQPITRALITGTIIAGTDGIGITAGDSQAVSAKASDRLRELQTYFGFANSTRRWTKASGPAIAANGRRNKIAPPSASRP